jgi:transposase
MAYIEGKQRSQHTLFPTTLDELIPQDHVCRVIEAFVGRLDMAKLGFVRSEPAETGRPGYDPRDLLKLYQYRYLWQIRSSLRLETECQRNVEVMWLLGRLVPDYKSITKFQRMCREAVTEAGAELVRFARSVGLVPGEWVAIDGSKFQSVSRVDRVREREALKRYLDQLERADEQHVPPKRTVNDHDGGKLFDRTEFVYDEESDTFRCPAGPTLWRKEYSKKDRALTYTPRRKVCGSCALKHRCTLSPRRYVSRNLHEDALQRMHQRTTAEVMRLRGSTVEHPFATIKYRIF